MAHITPYGMDMVCDLTDREWRDVELRLMLLTDTVSSDPDYNSCRRVEVRESGRHDYVRGGRPLFIEGWHREPGRRELRVRSECFTVTKGAISARGMVAIHDGRAVSVHDFGRPETATARKKGVPATFRIILPRNALLALSSNTGLGWWK